MTQILPKFLLDRGITKLLAFDFETYYDTHYTLKKMSTSMYIFDERFKVHGVGINYDNRQTCYFDDPIDVESFFDDVDWEHTALLGHHNQFDGLILTRKYNKIPAYYLCTLSMARPILMNVLKSLGIDSIAKHYGFEGKTEGLEETKGKRNLTPEERFDLGTYCINDVDIMIKVFNKLILYFPEFELDIINWHIRMYAEGEMLVDKELANEEIIDIEKRKVEMFTRVRKLFPPEMYKSDITTLKVLRSAFKFAEVIEYNKLPVPIKISPTTKKETHAFAKTDLEFKEFLSMGDIPTLLYTARVESKSDTALNKAKLLRRFADYPPIPVYLNYAKAVTLRSSGGDKIQIQNLPRGGKARRCLIAPEGFTILSPDSSGIELRIALWFSKQQDKIDLVNNNEDLYKDMAKDIYNISISEINKHQRGIGKVAILSNQYGAGIPIFDKMLKSGAMAAPLFLPYEEVQNIHATFRRSYDKVVNMWTMCTQFLYAMATNNAFEIDDYMGISFEPGRANTHEGMYLNYYNLTVDKEGTFTYQGANGIRKYIYGSLFFNNICQHIARNVVYKQINLVVQKYKPLMAVHDETSIIVRNKDFEEAHAYLTKCFTTAPSYLTGIKLNAEIEYAKNDKGISYYAK